jgi:hypothetical protein
MIDARADGLIPLSFPGLSKKWRDLGHYCRGRLLLTDAKVTITLWDFHVRQSADCQLSQDMDPWSGTAAS